MKKLLASLLCLAVSPAGAVLKAVPPRPASAVSSAASAAAAAPRAQSAALPSVQAAAPMIEAALAKGASAETSSAAMAAAVGEASFRPKSDAVLVPAYVKTAVVTAGVTLAPAAARAAEVSAQLEGLPSTVKWAAGIAGGLGFLLGSIPPNSEYAATQFDFPGAVTVGVAGALLAGGLAFGLVTGGWMIGGGAAAFGGLIGLMRLANTRPASRPTAVPLEAGVNVIEDESPKASFKRARKAFEGAAFSERGYYATRGLKEFRYPNGLSAADLQFYREVLPGARHDTFDILVLLVEGLPGRNGMSGVVVARGARDVASIQVTEQGLVIAGETIPASAIRAAVGYAWR